MPETYKTVTDKLGRSVAAKTLVDKNGNDVLHPTKGTPLVVPLSFDADLFIRYGREIAERSLILDNSQAKESPMVDGLLAGTQLSNAVMAGHDWDVQRTYNNVRNGGYNEFVEDFTPAASYAFGLMGAAIGFSPGELKLGGGLYNLRPNGGKNTSGVFGNNPDNVALIEAGAKAVGQKTFSEHGFSASAQAPWCFAAGTDILMGDLSTKKIENLKISDIVSCFSPLDPQMRGLKNKKVTKTFVNITYKMIDLRGLHCTPGHVFLTKGETGNQNAFFDCISEILRRDGTLIEADGSQIRARTGAQFGRADDALVSVVYSNPPCADQPGPERRALVRAGIPLPPVMIKDSLAPAQSLAQHLADHGITPLADGRLRTPDGTIHDACNWPEGATPFDTHEARNWIVQADGVPYCPPWIRDLVAEDETEGLRVVGALSA